MHRGSAWRPHSGLPAREVRVLRGIRQTTLKEEIAWPGNRIVAKTALCSSCPAKPVERTALVEADPPRPGGGGRRPAQQSTIAEHIPTTSR